MKPFRYYLRVRYSECDAQKVVFNARYGEYVDLAVTEYIRAVGLNLGGMFTDFDYQVVKQTTEWRAPARFDQVLEISITTKHLGTTSFTLLAEFRIAGTDAVTTAVETVYVNVDPKRSRKPLSPRTFGRRLQVALLTCRWIMQAIGGCIVRGRSGYGRSASSGDLLNCIALRVP